jgi:hypothetical protein
VTINVAVKCPEGIVLGCDSLTTITDDDGNIITSIPYTSKLFSLGNSQKPGKDFAVAVMTNGFHSIGGTRVEDIIDEYQEIYAKKSSAEEYCMADISEGLINHVQRYIDGSLKRERKINLEIIIAGFSKGKIQTIRNRKKNKPVNANNNSNKNRYGEIYSYIWEDKPKSRMRETLPTKDLEFFTLYGGQPTAIDRFRFGIDDWVLFRMLEHKDWLYEDIRRYIYNKLKRTKNIPEILEVEPPRNISQYNIFKLFSKGRPGKTPGETIRNIKQGMEDLKLHTMESQFSLQTAVNYCSFLLGCAYALSAFTFVTPIVGSEMRVGSITRNEGFKFRKVWEVQTPGPPFR